LAVSQAAAQSSAQSLADQVLQLWNTGSPSEFAAVYPYRAARNLVARFDRDKVERAKGLASVIRASGDRAVLLLSGAPLTGNSGDDTVYSMKFSSPYEARVVDGQWRLVNRIPLDEMGKILSHALKVSVQPGKGLDVVDRMAVRAKGADGFAARLNHRAQLRRVEAAGQPVKYQFGGGLLWIDVPKGQVELTLDYSLPVEAELANSGCFQDAFGHVRNQYFWHPFFEFGDISDQADFQIELRIPKQYRAITSLSQSERVDGDQRIVEGKTAQHTQSLTLAYDRDWNVVTEPAGKARLDLFLTPGFRPETAAVVQEFRAVHGQLADLFGEPSSGYAIVQLRGDPGNYWHFNSNQAVFTAGSPGSFSTLADRPTANLGHEIGHFWTHGTAPAASFLTEGWATYVESLVLQREFGTEGARKFWQYHAQRYFEDYDGKLSILEDTDNSDLSYDKGSWIFRMLEQEVGSEAFAKAMALYSRRSLAGSADWQTLADCFRQQNVPGFDAQEFLAPWLRERSAPRITTHVEGSTVTLHQDAPYFPLRVALEGTTAHGVERREVRMRSGDASVDFSGAVSKVLVDPDQLLLLKR
jgi:hypothetical protein